MTHTGELILRTLVFQFDGRVVEIVGGPNNDVIRYHVALLKEPQIGEPNRKREVPGHHREQFLLH
jgi:hypothetical protein